MDILYNAAGGNMQVLPVFSQACWGYVSIELINEQFISIREYDMMSHEQLHAVRLPESTMLRDTHAYGIDATFTLNSPDLVGAQLQFSQDGVVIGNVMLNPVAANGGLSTTLRVHCVPR